MKHPAQAHSDAMTDAAQQGYKANPDYMSDARKGHPDNPHLWSSDLWTAFELGFWLRENGHGTPYDVSPSRGYAVKCKIAGSQMGNINQIFRWQDKSSDTFTTFKRTI